MTIPRLTIGAALIAALLITPTAASALSASDLQAEAHPCKTPKAKRPRLPVNFEHDAPVEIFADFNGDGWCDYALGVPYPINSKMNSYSLNQILLLGQPDGWRHLSRSVVDSAVAREGFADHPWPIFRIDLTDIRLVYQKASAAPYVLGIFAGGDPGKIYNNGCGQYASVHRWDDEVGAFKRVDAATRDVVLNYFYTAIEKPCPPRKAQ